MEETTLYQTHKNGRIQRQCYPCKLQAASQRNQERKQKVMDHYGGCCSCCGEKILDFLAIDHINNDGASHRKKEKLSTGWHTYYWIIKNNYPEGFQVLCHNCNWAKHLHGVCPYHIFIEE